MTRVTWDDTAPPRWAKRAVAKPTTLRHPGDPNIITQREAIGMRADGRINSAVPLGGAFVHPMTPQYHYENEAGVYFLRRWVSMSDNQIRAADGVHRVPENG